MRDLYTAVLGAAGTGKQIPNDEIVMTPYGPTVMGNIELDDYVVARNGKPTKVIKVIKTQELNIYRVHFNDGTFVECCEDHLWKVQTRKNITNGSYQVKTLKELLPKINQPKKSSKEGSYYSIPLCDPVEFTEQITLIEPYLLGYLLGNGCLSRKSGVIITCNETDTSQLLSYFCKSSEFNFTRRTYQYAKHPNTGIIAIGIQVKEALALLNLLGKKSHDKFIPNEYLINSTEVRKAVLAGLLDSDGSINIVNGIKKKCHFTSMSVALIEGVSFLIRSLGGIVSAPTTSKRDGEIHISWRLPFNPFFIKRKREAYDSVCQHSHFVRKIVSAEFIGIKAGRCIDVEDEEHLFLLKDFIVTHNSYTIRENLKANPRYGLKTSSTGIAAVNIGGTTIHSTIGYFGTQELLYKVADGTLVRTLRKIATRYDRIIIDEISMFPAQDLDLIMRSLLLYNDKFTDFPLGLELVGDLGQLSVVSKQDDPHPSKPFIQAKHWPLFKIKHLTEIKRQDNPAFVHALMQIRAGEIEEAAEWFDNNIGFHSRLDDDYVGTTLLATNRDVDAYNLRSLRKISKVEKGYKKVLKGKNKGEWNNIPDEVVVKPESKVMLLVNKMPEYANGDLAIVREIFPDHLLVELVRTGNEHLIGYHTLTNNDISTNTEIGNVQFMPVRLADSSTIHKAQGLTTDALQIRITDPFIRRLSGGLYTGCSRVRTPEGLRLVGNKAAFIKACYVQEEFKPYLKVPDFSMAAA